MNGDYGISFEKESGEQEEAANRFAEDSLIPKGYYQEFIRQGEFDLQAIKKFANKINRDPGIVLGRLQKDKKIDYNDYTMNTLRHKYKVCTKFQRIQRAVLLKAEPLDCECNTIFFIRKGNEISRIF